MTTAIVALAILAGLLGVIVALVTRWAFSAKDQAHAAVKREVTEMGEHALTKLALAQSDFERDKHKAALAVAEATITKLTEELSHAPLLGAGLAPDDVDGRLRRLAAREAGATGDSLPAESGAVVPAGPATVEAGTADLRIITELR